VTNQEQSAAFKFLNHVLQNVEGVREERLLAKVSLIVSGVLAVASEVE